VAASNSKLVLAPAANGSASINFERSVIEGISLDELAALPPATQVAVGAHAASGVVRMWGSRANKADMWAKVKRGDLVLFYSNKRFVALARVAGKRRDRALADSVWEPDPSSWENVLFLRDLLQLSLPVSAVGTLLGYRANWNGPREFFVPAPQAQANALLGLDSVKDLAASWTADAGLSRDEPNETYADVVGRVSSKEDVKALLDRLKARNTRRSPDAARRAVERLKRDALLVLALKALYDGRCQVCGDTFVVVSTGANYCEGAHRVPLSTRHPGIDSYLNLVILCATCHKKLDYGGMRIDWDAGRQGAYYEWDGQRHPLLLNEHIDGNWSPAQPDL
jgi:5-methylcytosine-specific restriction endonuclease McrA